MSNHGLPRWATILAGAFLMGLLWRVRGTGGWGSAWGLLNAGLVFTLFLAGTVKKEKAPSFRLVSLAALSFMLTAPAWGTLLTQITGVIRGETIGEGAEDILINPAVGALTMALMGFGLAGVFGVMLGRCFSEKAWSLKEYLLVLGVFLLAAYGAKATVAHPLVKLIEPQAYNAFAQGIANGNLGSGVYGTYMAHFNAEGWAKHVFGGRHYYALVSAVSSAIGATAAILAARFLAKDRYAAKTGAVVCGAFAVSITLADLFFFFSYGGYRMAQGFSLPENFAAWSLWEYFTGFLAGGLITAFVLRTAPAGETKETLLRKVPEKWLGAITFVFCCIGAVGVNIVRPVLRRFEDTKLLIPAVIAAVLFALGAALLLVKKYGFRFEKAEPRRFYPALCLFLSTFIILCYLFIGPAEKQEFRSLGMAHNMLVIASYAVVTLYCGLSLRSIA